MHTMWKGSIRFGLVHIPIKLYAATEEKGVKFRLLHQKCSTPIKYSRVCPHCDVEVSNDDIVKGYEYEPGQFVTLEQSELDSIKGDVVRAIEILDFVNLHDIDSIYFNKSYFIGPHDNGEKAYALLKQALQDTEKIGMAMITLHSKQHLAIVRPYEQGLLLETIYYPDEVRSVADVPNIHSLGEINSKELKTAIQFIDQLTVPFDPAAYQDDYREKVMALIEEKATGKHGVTKQKTKEKTNMVDLLSALEASIAETKPKAKSTTKTTKTKRKTKTIKKASS
ncbi:Ku protein [Terrilactibacillus sp. BCM23-1]|uniref:Non-homologous end joining protein Ku n=1 Tax=Terrilactibacillus tamarindi TaxID=2599694 RepID=A0A6N8CM79_9BACI|nr:Ku protein [Terrilactibacillus tamarindi]MTT30550.1 Ku protein [Terrilactibacillus tamarindi]